MTYRIKAIDVRAQVYTIEASDTDEAMKKLDDAIMRISLWKEMKDDKYKSTRNHKCYGL